MNIDSTTIINGLIKIGKDNENGFIKVAEEVQDAQVKELFLKGAKDSRELIDELSNLVAAKGVEPVESGSFFGAIHRGWIDLVSMVTQHNTHSILAECERGQDTIKAAYRKALEQENLPMDVKAVIEQQFIKVKALHDLVRDTRDQYAKD